jgi:SAM-dependent methyltransferase
MALISSYNKLRRIGIDTPQRTILHSQVIQDKPFLRRLYTEWYTAIKGFLPSRPSGCLIELGSGGGFAKQIFPRVVTTEILSLPTIDLQLDGEALPFKSKSLKGIFMIDVFHHLPGSKQFLADAARCIKPGGVIVMIEPWNTFFSRFIYRYLHHEPFESDIIEWQLPCGGPLSQANSALPWIVFMRDRMVFESVFPQWQINAIELHTPFRYLLSGGLSIKGLMPGALFDFWRNVEKYLQPWMEHIALFATIVLVRKKEMPRTS